MKSIFQRKSANFAVPGHVLGSFLGSGGLWLAGYWAASLYLAGWLPAGWPQDQARAERTWFGDGNRALLDPTIQLANKPAS